MTTTTIAPAKTSMISLAQIDIPTDARSHDPAALEILAHDMGEQGQLQEIIVVPVSREQLAGSSNGGPADCSLPPDDCHYQVIAGVGRTLAARKLGWKEIRASVREGVSDFDKARITFAENEDREDVDPFYQAGLISKMLKEKNCTQKALGSDLGISEATVNAYQAVYQLPDQIKKLRRLSLGQLTQIARLNNADSKIEFAQNCAKNDLSVRQLKALVDRALKKPSARTPSRSQSPTPIPDPLADVWPSLKKNLKMEPEIFWLVHYGIHKLPNGEPMKGWFFFASPFLDPKPELATWFSEMGKAMGGGSKQVAGSSTADCSLRPANSGELPEILQEVEAAKKAVADYKGTVTRETSDEDSLSAGVRLPRTAEEEQELKSIAVRGTPKDVYIWIYGPDSPMMEAVPVGSWNDLGTTAEDGLKQILAGIQQFQKMAT